MSQKEFQHVKVIENAVKARLSVGEEAPQLQLSERQVQRLKWRYRPDSVDWVHYGNRGRILLSSLNGGRLPGCLYCSALSSERHTSANPGTTRWLRFD